MNFNQVPSAVRQQPAPASKPPRVGVVVPCYRVRSKILDVLSAIGPEVERIYVVDDGCPEQTGHWVEQCVTDRRVCVIFHTANKGVGAAVVSGMRSALNESMDVIVKLDGDGQMAPAMIGKLIRPIVEARADYTKGNRFFDIESVRPMPIGRLIGNAVLTFLAKTSTGYWNIADPTNGFVAVDARIIRVLPLHKLAARYFFESDLLFRLNTLQAVVVDVPMTAVYGNETSNLKIHRVGLEFLFGHCSRFVKRIFYNYYLRNFNVASVELALGVLLLTFGVVFGATTWLESLTTMRTASTGTVMLASLPLIVGMQLLLGFVNYDVSRTPTTCVGPQLEEVSNASTQPTTST